MIFELKMYVFNNSNIVWSLYCERDVLYAPPTALHPGHLRSGYVGWCIQEYLTYCRWCRQPGLVIGCGEGEGAIDNSGYIPSAGWLLINM